MSIYKLQYAMEHFHLCSHLSIYAFDNKGEMLLATGTTGQAHDYMSLMPMWACDFIKSAVSSGDKIINQSQSNQVLLNMPSSYHKIITTSEAVHFSLYPINNRDIQKGIYIIGPYTSHFDLKDTYLLKPLHCMESLLRLLQDLPQTNTSNILSEDAECNYHVEKAKSYIRDHYKEPITLEQLASHLMINKSYFCTIFKKSTKISFCQYTNTIRIEESKKLLKDTNNSILDIALTTGFSSASYFNTIFKKQEGITPLNYRQQQHHHLST